MVYRVQNLALDLTIPGGENALLIRVDEKNSASCTHVPRQISKSELIQLLPNNWITDYENLHTQANEPLESSNSRISLTSEGRTSISFDHSHLKPLTSKSYPSIMIAQVPIQDIIQYFNQEGLPVYWFQDPISGHIFFDVCAICEECQLAEILGCDASDLTDYPKKRRKPRSIDPEPIEPRPCKPDLDPQDPDTDTFVSKRSKFNGYQISSDWIPRSFTESSPSSKKDLHPYYQECLNILEKEAKQSKTEWKPKPFWKNEPLVPIHTPQVQECFMFREEDFPKLETFNNNGARHTLKIQNVSLQFFQVEKLLDQTHSLPKSLADGAEMYIHNKYGSILNLTIGQIKQAVLLSLDDLCNKRK
ncbi:unnamed protein product [Coffea canephora]|uniref:DH200=94 genomic scaffold, scaffold_1343 n=1 Tax=Coffea canephora TaxID=49390 RepID=A0A068VIL5_COFCA|nr:unnamed protein product [Coffea canephora]